MKSWSLVALSHTLPLVRYPLALAKLSAARNHHRACPHTTTPSCRPSFLPFSSPPRRCACPPCLLPSLPETTHYYAATSHDKSHHVPLFSASSPLSPPLCPTSIPPRFLFFSPHCGTAFEWRLAGLLYSSVFYPRPLSPFVLLKLRPRFSPFRISAFFFLGSGPTSLHLEGTLSTHRLAFVLGSPSRSPAIPAAQVLVFFLLFFFSFPKS